MKRAVIAGCIVGLLLGAVFCTRAQDNGAAGERLPAPRTKGRTSLEEALSQRRSMRSYTTDRLSLEDVSQLLWAAQGITSKDVRRTAPSAGGLYPMEIYMAVGRNTVGELGQGVYHYNPKAHALRKVKDVDLREDIGVAAVGQGWIARAPAVFVVTGVVGRTARKYGPRAQRYVFMEAGHVAQNVLLQATVLDLGGTPVGAFHDTDLRKVIGLGSEYLPCYVIPIGKPQR